MKTKILAAAILALMACAPAGAQPAGTGDKQPTALQSEKHGRASTFAQSLEKVDAIEKPLLELEARYWAWDIQNLGRTSYEDLKEKSKRWIIKPETRDQLFAKIKAHLDSGPVTALTRDERARLDESKKQIRLTLSPGRGDTRLIESLSLDYCIDLQARYWAKRIQDGETGIMQNARTTWPLTKTMRAKMIAAMEEKLRGKNENLTREELYKFDACGAKIHGQP